MLLQIFEFEKPTAILGHLDNCFCDPAGVKAFLSFFGECSESVGQVRVLEELTRSRSTIRAVWILLEELCKIRGCLLEQFLAISPLSHD